MNTTLRNACLGLLTGALFLLPGCGSSGNSNNGTTTVLVLDAVVDAEPLDVLIDDQAKINALAPGASAAMEVDSGTRSVKARSSTSGAVLASRTGTFNANTTYSVYFHGKRSAIQTLLLSDDTGNPNSGRFKLRVLDLDPDVGIVDVYVGGADISATTPVFLSLGYGGVIDFTEINVGSLTVTFAAAGTKDIVFQSAATAFTEGQKATVALLPSRGAKLANAVLLSNGTGTLLPNASSRVKAVNGIPGTTLTFRVGSTTSLESVAFAAASAYVTAPAGSTTLAVEATGVPGTALATVTRSLDPARDHTLLAMGSPGAAQLVLLADDNGVPVAGSARVRFVNANAEMPAVDALLNFVGRASGLAPGTASGYVEVTGAATYTATFVSPGGTTVVASVEGTLDVGGVYTAYLFGPASSPTARIVRDR